MYASADTVWCLQLFSIFYLIGSLKSAVKVQTDSFCSVYPSTLRSQHVSTTHLEKKYPEPPGVDQERRPELVPNTSKTKKRKGNNTQDTIISIITYEGGKGGSTTDTIGAHYSIRCSCLLNSRGKAKTLLQYLVLGYVARLLAAVIATD